MVLPKQLPKSPSGEFYCRVNLNLYDSPICERLATQAAVGRQIRILSLTPVGEAIEMYLAEDGYSGWLPIADVVKLEPAAKKYQALPLTTDYIREQLPAVIAFTKKAMQQPNYYLWGGTVGPNYDCSGLMQAAFAASGIWLPRDSYQQEDFTQKIELSQLLPGDFVFFATAQKVDHVGLYLGDGSYIHSSSKDTGRNGIAIDQLSDQADAIAQSYYQKLRGVGRVVETYQPENC
ncbi:NlpC/P60 family protein [Lyngbya aestuarii]|uniref:NlpC/P60 family protein n=1 Tax=Lyngbya aestuarii TaxID=118322 RepID=UPI00403DA6C6